MLDDFRANIDFFVGFLGRIVRDYWVLGKDYKSIGDSGDYFYLWNDW